MRQTNDEFNLDPSKYQQAVQEAKLQQESFSPRHHDNTVKRPPVVVIMTSSARVSDHTAVRSKQSV